jgi:hypothetical protein
MVRLDRSRVRVAAIIGVAAVLAILLALGASNSL